MNKYINIMIITIECNQCDNSYDVPIEVPVTMVLIYLLKVCYVYYIYL